VFRVTHNGHATRAKHTGDLVAQSDFIRIAPATPNALSPIESCGVADKTATIGAARRGTSLMAALHPLQFQVEKYFAEDLDHDT
jgi:hypothetical protein